MGDAKKTAEKAVKDIGKTVEKAVNDTGNYLSNDLSDDLLNIGNKTLEVGGNVVYYATGGSALKWVDENIFNDNLDIFSGGLVTDIDNAHIGKTLGDLGRGKAVDDNLKSTVRVGAVAGTAVATGGSSLAVNAGATMAMTQSTGGLAGEGASTKSWEQLFGGVAQGAGHAIGGVGKTVGNIVNNIINPPDEIVPIWTNDDNPLAGFYAENEDSKKIVLIVALLVSVGILTVALSTKKKRK